MKITGRALGQVNSMTRALALVLALTFGLLAATVVQTPTRAYAAPLVLPAAAAAALPLSVVSAGVGGGISAVTTGAAIAGAGITAAAAFASNFAVSAGFSWSPDAPATLGDPVPASGGGGGGTFSFPTGRCAKLVQVAYVSTEGTFTNYDITVREVSPAGCTNTFVTVGYVDGAGVYGQQGAVSGGGLGTVQRRALTTSATMWIQAYQTSGTYSPYQLFAGGPPSAPPPGADPGTTPLTITPRTCYALPGGGSECVNGSAVATTRNTPGGIRLDFPAVPSGASLTSRAAPITRTADGSVVGDAVTGQDSPTPTAWQPPPVPARFPDCGGGTCVMTLTVTDPAGRTSTCGPGNACASYAQVVQQNPQVGEGAATGPRTAPDGNSYQCRFGPYAVSVAECQVIPGVGLAPAVDTSAGNCLGGIGWNPTTWVTVPVKCALSWAFQLTPATQARVSSVGSEVAAAPPFSVLSTVPNWLAPIADLGQTCPDWQVKVGPVQHSIVCGQGYTQTMNDNRLLFGLAMTLAMLGPFAWRVWHSAIPILKVNARAD